MSTRWDGYFLRLARVISTNSRCYSRQIGVVVVKNKAIVSTGYNGPPARTKHCEERNPNKELECPRQLLGYSSGERLEICRAAHAETNAIANAAKMGHSLKDAIMYCDCGIPCNECAKLIINAGIREVVVTELKEYSKAYPSMELFNEAGVRVRNYYA